MYLIIARMYLISNFIVTFSLYSYTTNQNDLQVILQLHYDTCILTGETFH